MTTINYGHGRTGQPASSSTLHLRHSSRCLHRHSSLTVEERIGQHVDPSSEDDGDGASPEYVPWVSSYTTSSLLLDASLQPVPGVSRHLVL